MLLKTFECSKKLLLTDPYQQLPQAASDSYMQSQAQFNLLSYILTLIKSKYLYRTLNYSNRTYKILENVSFSSVFLASVCTIISLLHSILGIQPKIIIDIAIEHS